MVKKFRVILIAVRCSRIRCFENAVQLSVHRESYLKLRVSVLIHSC